jgi:hypothetical protein
MRRTTTAIAATVLLAGCGGGDAGYKDPATLAARLKTTAQQRMDKDPEHVRPCARDRHEMRAHGDEPRPEVRGRDIDGGAVDGDRDGER